MNPVIDLNQVNARGPKWYGHGFPALVWTVWYVALAKTLMKFICFQLILLSFYAYWIKLMVESWACCTLKFSFSEKATKICSIPTGSVVWHEFPGNPIGNRWSQQLFLPEEFWSESESWKIQKIPYLLLVYVMFRWNSSTFSQNSCCSWLCLFLNWQCNSLYKQD